jgi:hypothetical protein
MQSTIRCVVGVAGVWAAAVLTPPARAQVPGRPAPGPVLTFIPRQTIAVVPAYSSAGVQTTVTAPGGVSLGGYSRLSGGRVEAGVPALGRVPFGGRGFGNVGYGRSAFGGRVSVRVRVIDLREEEYRQTGYRSR